MGDIITITLTGRQPVSISKDAWPVIASARDWDNQHESQANRTWRVTVRQHEDGRTIVYGVHTSQWQGERDSRHGELVEAGGNIAAAIVRVCESIGAEHIAQECVGGLPAVEL